jgi:hypothetical protein
VNEESKELPNKDFFRSLIKYMTEEGMPEAEKLMEVLESVENRAQISVTDHLAFGDCEDPGQLRCLSRETGGKDVGELNRNDELQGRGVSFWMSGGI